MSYAFDLAADARAALHTLDVDLQERIYDELEVLCADPALLTPRGKDITAVHDFVVQRDDGAHYVFITLERHDVTRLLRILSVARLRRPLPPTSA